MPEHIVLMPWNHLHLEDHGMILAEKAKTVSQIQGCHIKQNLLIAVDDEFFGWQSECMFLNGDLKGLICLDLGSG